MSPSRSPPPVCLCLRLDEHEENPLDFLLRGQDVVQDENDQDFIWKVDNKYYTAIVNVKV